MSELSRELSSDKHNTMYFCRDVTNEDVWKLCEEVEALEAELAEAKTELLQIDKSQWIDEARQIAAQCWCDDETKHLNMIPELAESVARRISAWMGTGAFHCRNEMYWKQRAETAEARVKELEDKVDYWKEAQAYAEDQYLEAKQAEKGWCQDWAVAEAQHTEDARCIAELKARVAELERERAECQAIRKEMER